VEQHRADYAEWMNGLEGFRKENPEYPSFEELYGKVSKRRKRKGHSVSCESEEEVDIIHDKMDIEMDEVE
jgi:hypothetical protein